MQKNNLSIQIDPDLDCNAKCALQLIDAMIASHIKFKTMFRPGTELSMPGTDKTFSYLYNEHSIFIRDFYDSEVIFVSDMGGNQKYSFLDTDLIDIKKNVQYLFGMDNVCGGFNSNEETLLYYDPVQKKYKTEMLESDILDEIHFQMNTMHDIYNIEYIRQHVDHYIALNAALSSAPGDYRQLYVSNNDFFSDNPNIVPEIIKGLL